MTDDELYEAFEKAFPEAEDYAKTYAHMPLDRYKAPYDDMFEGFDAGVRVVEERITAASAAIAKARGSDGTD